MSTVWLAPLLLLVGFAGTRTALREHRSAKNNPLTRDWWILIPLAWLPSLCWLASFFVVQG